MESTQSPGVTQITAAMRRCTSRRELGARCSTLECRYPSQQDCFVRNVCVLGLYGFSKVNAVARGHTRDLRVLRALEAAAVHRAEDEGVLFRGLHQERVDGSQKAISPYAVKVAYQVDVWSSWPGA